MQKAFVDHFPLEDYEQSCRHLEYCFQSSISAYPAVWRCYLGRRRPQQVKIPFQLCLLSYCMIACVFSSPHWLCMRKRCCGRLCCVVDYVDSGHAFFYVSRRMRSEILRENKRMLDRSIRDIERERMQLQQQEKKLIAEIKKTAKQGQMVRLGWLGIDQMRSHLIVLTSLCASVLVCRYVSHLSC